MRVTVIKYLAIMISLNTSAVFSQDERDHIMLQSFYWDVPVDEEHLNGMWWDSLRTQAREFADAGFTSVWTPPPSKGAFSIYDMGYGVYDHYDLGEYEQKGNIDGVPSSAETRFGSKDELIKMVAEFQSYGIDVYTDIVLNHMYGGSYEFNPVVTEYVNDERYPTYPASQLKWVFPDAQPGEYYIDIKGYNLDGDVPESRVYEVHIKWFDEPHCDANASPKWQMELPVQEEGSFVYPGSGCAVYGIANLNGDTDTYKIILEDNGTIAVRIYPRYDDNGTVQWNSDDNGYRVNRVVYDGKIHTMQIHTVTSFRFVEKTDVPDLNWSYTHFNPVHEADYLEDEGIEDEVRPNWMIYGVDLNTRDPEVRRRLIDWGVWLTNTAGFDGYRLDFVRGLEQDFVAEWLRAMPLRNGKRRFSVAEYWTHHPHRIREWIDIIQSYDAHTAVFDFPLRRYLMQMCNDSEFDMSRLNNAGMIRATQHALAQEKVVTFLENHDTGKEHDKWITRDWHLGYAFILFADGIPSIFYPHYYEVEQVDMINPDYTVTADAGLQMKIDELMSIRKKYLAGRMEVLTQVDEPFPPERIKHLFVGRREGNEKKPGGILVLNNHPTDTLGVNVSTNVPEWRSLKGKYLTNVTEDKSKGYKVDDEHRVKLYAPPRGYAIYVLENDVNTIKQRKK